VALGKLRTPMYLRHQAV